MLAQTTIVPVNDKVYEFLERMELKGIITYSFVKPFTYNYVKENLELISKNDSLLTTLDNEDLHWYMEKFGVGSTENKKMLLQYHSPDFYIGISPILGYRVSKTYDEIETKRWGLGINIISSIGNKWGFQMDFRDNSETGKRIDKTKLFSKETGMQIIGGKGNEIQYSEVKGGVTYSNGMIFAMIGKEWFKWGSGYRGNLILSEKAPSFPFFRLDITPTDWMRLYYIHAWLNSRVPDSSRYYSSSTVYPRIIDREKYYAAHAIEIKPLTGLTITLGESIVYSDQIRVGFFIPVLFFRLVDHYYEGSNAMGKGGNSQIFSDANFTFHHNRFYTSFFIDEFSLTNLLKGNNSRNQLGYTFGFANYDLLPNLMTRIEYTRVLPWVYSNFIQTQTYTNSNYLMGHYIGQNADQIFLQFDYRFIRGLETKVWGEYIRRGGMGAIENQYQEPGEPFLYGLRRNETNIGLEVSYEYLHDLFGKVYYQYSNVTDEDKTRTPNWELGVNHTFGFSMQYGM
jgi:hypothetical protein